jgi:HEAT repeat protein/energy-coupling factor transporter ATP-binding protein EcfA2
MIPISPMSLYQFYSGAKNWLDLYIARENASKKYHQNLQDRYNNLDLSGLDNGAGELEKPAEENDQIKLRKMFVEQNVREYLWGKLEQLPPREASLAPATSMSRNEDIIPKLPADRDSNSEQSEGYEELDLGKSSGAVLKVLAEENSRCVTIVGGPGSGKSTLLQYLALGWADEETKQFPVIIELGAYTTYRVASESFLEFWYRGSGAIWKFDRDKFEENLNSENSLVMFDGLDEIADRQVYRDVVNKIIEFSDRYGRAKIIVTSRIGGYSPERLRNAKFRHLILQDLSKAQIDIFIEKWYDLRLKNDLDKPGLKQRMKQAIADSTAVQNLANNPQILTMMAIILNRHYSLPSERELYYLASRVRLDNSDEEDLVVDAIERQEKQAILGLIACEMQFGSSQVLGGNSIDDESLKDLLTSYLDRKMFKQPRETAVRTIQQLQGDNFILSIPATSRFEHPDGDTYSFVHRKFLGYFCAAEIARRFEKKKLISFEQLRDLIFGRYWRDENRHRSLRLICGLLAPESAGKLVEFLMEQKVNRVDYLDRENRATMAAFQHLQLAGECLAEVRGYPAIFTIAEKLKAKLRAEIDSYPGISLSFGAAKLLTNAIAKYYRSLPEANSIVQYYQTKSDTLSWFKSLALQHRDRFIRTAAIQSILEYYHLKNDTLNWLKDLAFTSLYEDVRSTVVESIDKYYRTDADTYVWYTDIAFRDRHELVRRTTVESIVKADRTEHDILTWLKDRAFVDPHEWVRRATVESIAKYYSMDIYTLSWLKDLAFADRHELVRRAIVESVLRYYSTDVDTLNWLKNCAFIDKDRLVRTAAVWCIAELDCEQPNSLHWLKTKAFGDKDPGVRSASIQSIVKYYCLDADRLIQTQNCALYDQNEQMRRESVKLLIEYSDILNWLKNSALHDSHELVRRTAVRAISDYYQTLPEILTWLQDCAAEQDPDVRWAIVWSLSQPLSDKIGIDKTQIVTWLKQHALNDSHELVRRAAIQALAKYYRGADLATKTSMGFRLESSSDFQPSTASTNLPDTVSCILLTLKDSHELVRRAGLDALVTYYHTNRNTLVCVHHALDDSHELVRLGAVELIAKYYHTEPATIDRLKDLAIQDPDKDVRRIAVQSIARYYRPNLDTLNWFKDKAFIDAHEWVRKTAVRSIAANYHRHIDTLIWLQIYTFNTEPEDIEIRRVAVEAIAKHYRTEPNTLNWLKNVAFKHPNEWVRRTVVESIARYYATEPSTLNWIKERGFQDSHQLVRRAAVRSIVEYFIRAEGVFELLCQLAAPNPSIDRHTDLKPRQIALKALDKHYLNRPQTNQLWLLATEDPHPGLRKWAEDRLKDREELI